MCNREVFYTNVLLDKVLDLQRVSICLLSLLLGTTQAEILAFIGSPGSVDAFLHR